MQSTLRIVQIILGIIAIGLSLYVILNPPLALSYVITLLSIILIITGIERIVHGISSDESSKSSKVGNIILGIVGIGFGIFVSAYPVFTTGLLLTIMAIGLLAIGIARIITGLYAKESPKWLKALMIISGSIAIIVAILVFAYPSLGVVLLTLIVSISLLIIGIDSLIQGVSGRKIKLTK
ncbi:MAG: hypothetical protein DA328_03610 [Nitrososphaeraceae archaeon]|nr:hypothetical protein [Nitrososphaeraceae archaeon]